MKSARPAAVPPNVPRAKRLRSLTKRPEAATLQAIGNLFLAQGFSGVSIDAINRVTGGSKRDLYQQFGDKEELFRRVVAELCRERVELLAKTMPRGKTAAESLQLGGEAFLDMLMAPRTLALHRLLVAEGHRLSEVASNFLQEGPSKAYTAFAELLNSHAAQGDIQLADAEVTARLFLDGISGSLQLRALVNKQVPRQEMQAIVKAAVDLFSIALAVKRKGTPSF